ncbi:exonuclease domain-containing protein [Streptomyces sp. NPDC056652]|uniref:exonuclease domain-containing protein n=1 Tax=Streptomyces sp. NPDC056652 TaxID=3345893 RepID=UPI0036C259DE
MSTVTEAGTLPVYKSGEAPEHLRTATQLKTERLKVADGQLPVGFLRVYLRGRGGWQNAPLYDPTNAAKMRPLSAKQQRARNARRTCPKCATVRGYIVYQRCQECREEAEQARRELYARTCHHCKRVSGAVLAEDAYGWKACEPCRIRLAIRKQVELERRATWARTCPGRDCTVVTATDVEIAAGRDEDAAQALRSWGWSPRWCPPCEEREGRERAEREQQQWEAEQRAVEAREREVRDLEDWARKALEDHTVVILDTETTGLDDDARIVEIAVTTAAGDVLLDTLVKPDVPIPAEATEVHGITDAMVAGEPSFSEALGRLTTVLNGRRCLIYNKVFDVARLRWELTRRYEAAEHDQPEESAAAWLDAMTFEDAMVPYSDWVGDWSEYWGNYTWQSLDSGHRALGDCLAVTDCLRAMAKGRGSE